MTLKSKSKNTELKRVGEVGSSMMWVVTGVLVLGILGVAVFVATKQQQPVTQPAPVEPYRAPEPVREPVAEPAPAMPEPLTPMPFEEDVVAAPEPEPVPETVPPEPVAEPTPVKPSGPVELQLDNLAGTMTVESLAFERGRNKLPLRYTCYRDNVSPHVAWDGAPPGTQSFVVMLEKREPGKSPFHSWIIFNVPGEKTSLPPRLPKDAELADGMRHALSDHKNVGYIGPCEAKGKFKYALRVFAINKVLDVQPGVGKYDLFRAMNGHILDAKDLEFIHYFRL